MKKNIIIVSAVLLISILAFALVFALGSVNSDNEPTENNIPSEPTDPIVNPTDPIDINDRVAMWEHIFANKLFNIDESSFVIASGDIIITTVVIDDSGKSYKSMCGTVQGNFIEATLYQQNDETAYFYSYTKEKNKVVEQWNLCKISNQNDRTTLDEVMDGQATPDEITRYLDSIEELSYIKSIENMDYINIYCTANGDDADQFVMQVAIDSTTYEIKEIVTSENMVTTTIQFIDCHDIADVVEVPKVIEHEMSVDEAVKQFASTANTLVVEHFKNG
jgi:hypothetical protein